MIRVLSRVLLPVLLLSPALSALGQDAHHVCKPKFKTDELTTGTDPQSIVTGDFNKDGKLDFAQVNYTNGSPGTVAVWLGNGDGTFQAPVTYSAGSGPDALAVADVTTANSISSWATTRAPM